MPSQPHHRQLALHALADVVLDSHGAGGCTSTREALEVGGLVVTLPGKYLGGRWTQAFYRILGVSDLVATDAADYARIAVRLATEPAEAAALRRRIAEALPQLYESRDAVKAWTRMLMGLALPPALKRTGDARASLTQPPP